MCIYAYTYVFIFILLPLGVALVHVARGSATLGAVSIGVWGQSATSDKVVRSPPARACVGQCGLRCLRRPAGTTAMRAGREAIATLAT